MEELNTKEQMTEYSKYYWANEEARKFLSRGYITETLEQRIKDISNKAESILKIDGFATKFEDYMAKGYYSLSTPVWINFGKDKGLPISCVVKNTIINTIDGTKLAKDIVIGDMVLTHENRYKPVTHIIPTANKDNIYKLKVNGNEILITGNHPVLTNRGWINVDELNVEFHLIAFNILIETSYKTEYFKIEN